MHNYGNLKIIGKKGGIRKPTNALKNNLISYGINNKRGVKYVFQTTAEPQKITSLLLTA